MNVMAGAVRRAAFIAAVIAAIAAATLVFYVSQHQLSSLWLDVTLRPEVRDALQHSLDDQKRLRTLDPAHAAEYRRRFEETRTLLNHIDVLRMNRRAMLLRYELALAAIFAVVLIVAAVVAAVRYVRNERRLAAIQHGLEALSRGDAAITLGERRRDVIARIARMIEETSRVVSGERRRLAYLEHLSTWQEAARRHAHEIRTPLTAARLEVDRLVTLSAEQADRGAIERAKESVFEELDRLSRFTKEFSSFATVPQPVLREESLAEVVSEFEVTFATAWPRLTFAVDARTGARTARALVDRDMLRQVLVNLCANAAAAGANRMVLSVDRDERLATIDVRDDGHGIAPAIRSRLFEPYVTTRKIGEGMGLGLAISRKILLDHAGDLELRETSARGTWFRITLPLAGVS
jgi:signal transduction histidine kinase